MSCARVNLRNSRNSWITAENYNSLRTPTTSTWLDFLRAAWERMVGTLKFLISSGTRTDFSLKKNNSSKTWWRLFKSPLKKLKTENKRLVKNRRKKSRELIRTQWHSTKPTQSYRRERLKKTEKVILNLPLWLAQALYQAPICNNMGMLVLETNKLP